MGHLKDEKNQDLDWFKPSTIIPMHKNYHKVNTRDKQIIIKIGTIFNYTMKSRFSALFPEALNRGFTVFIKRKTIKITKNNLIILRLCIKDRFFWRFQHKDNQTVLA